MGQVHHILANAESVFLKKKKKIFTLIIISLCGLHILGTKNQEKEH